MKRVLAILALLVLAPACGSSPKSKPEPTTPTKPEPTATPTATDPAGFTSDDDYVARAMALINTIIDVFKANGTDCEKVAAGLSRVIDDNRALIAAAKAYENDHAAAKERFDNESKDLEKKFEDSAGPTMQACQNNDAFMAAMKKLSES